MRAIVFLCLLGADLVQAQYYPWDGLKGGSTLSPPTGRDTEDYVACTTDQRTCGCCVLRRQLDSLEHFINSTTETLQEDLNSALDTIDGLKANRSAFSAALSNRRLCEGEHRVDVIVIYHHVSSNLGDNYNVNNGVYTAPLGGVYIFTVTIYSDSGSEGNPLAACARLMVNDTIIARSRDKNRQDQEDSATIYLALTLNRGDRVYVVLPAGCFLCDDNSHYNTFTGYLIYPTY